MKVKSAKYNTVKITTRGDVSGLFNRIWELEAQRDELLAAAKAVLGDGDSDPLPPALGDLAKLRVAIKKAESHPTPRAA